MSNYQVSVDFFGNNVRAETEGRLVCANDLLRAGNAVRTAQARSPKTMQQIMSNSVAFAEYLEAAIRAWGLSKEEMIQVRGAGRTSRTMVHYALAVFLAEQLSPDFHAQAIKTFIEGKLLEFREQGGTEFKNLNAAIDLYLPDRAGKDNKGCFITIAKQIRKRILGEAEGVNWETASAAQVHARYLKEERLVMMLSNDGVRDWEHLKQLADKL